MNNLSRHIKSVAASVLAVAVTAVSPAFMHAKAADASSLGFDTATSLLNGTGITCKMENYTADKTVDYLQVTISANGEDFGYIDSTLNNLAGTDNMEVTENYDSATGRLNILYEPKVSGAFIPADTAELFAFKLSSSLKREYKLDINYVVCYTDGTDAEMTDELNVVIPRYGDVNDDGSVNIKDLLRYKKYIADKSTTFEKINGNLSGNASYSASDLVLLKKILTGAIKTAE